MTTTVSDEQEAAIGFGMRRGEKSWRRLSLPTGPQDIPAWARDAHIDWMDGYGNFPQIQLRLAYDPLETSGARALKPEDLKPVWTQPKPGTFIAICEGMASVHYHTGRIAHHLRQWGWGKNEDGSPNYRRPAMTTSDILCTTQEQGYGGRSFFIRMAEDDPIYPGQTIELRGPWHGGAPAGFVEVHCHVNKPEDAKNRAWRIKHLKHLGPDRSRWWNLSLSFGWYVEQETFFKIIAHHLPHIEWAEVDHGNWIRLEPIDPRTGCPKGFTPTQESK